MNTLSVPYVDLAAQWQDEKKDLLPIIESVMSSGQFVGGEAVERFEHKLLNCAKPNTVSH